jgi:hypothetical protein
MRCCSTHRTTPLLARPMPITARKPLLCQVWAIPLGRRRRARPPRSGLEFVRETLTTFVCWYLPTRLGSSGKPCAARQCTYSAPRAWGRSTARRGTASHWEAVPHSRYLSRACHERKRCKSVQWSGGSTPDGNKWLAVIHASQFARWPPNHASPQVPPA